MVPLSMIITTANTASRATGELPVLVAIAVTMNATSMMVTDMVRMSVP